MSDPLITIGLPLFNADRTLGEAIRSIRSQTYGHWELLIIDDGSSDRSPEVAIEAQANDSRIRFSRDDRHIGLPGRLNQALGLARGELFARMDADDIAYPRRFERQVRFLRAHPDVDVVGSQMMIFGSDGTAKGVRRCRSTHAEICAHPQWGFRVFHPTWTGRTSWFARYGYRAGYAEDQDLLLRAYRESRFANLPQVLLGYRQDRDPRRYDFKGRSTITRRVARAMLREGRADLAAASVAKFLALGASDVVAYRMGIEERVLRQRATPASESELAAWRAVYKSLSDPASTSPDAVSRL
jgi:glycosyltransferase involved in cell wall biosynthesis